MDADSPITDVDTGQPIDPRTLGLGLLASVEEEYAHCLPLVCYEPAWAALWRLGVSGRAINGRNAFDVLNFERAVFMPGDRFEFAKYLPGREALPAAIIPAHDDRGELIDLAAWAYEQSRLAMWRGVLPALGLENITRPRIDGPVIAHETILGWLRAGREGIFITDPACAARRLEGITIGVESVEFGLRLRDSMTIAPRIAFSRRERRAA